MQSDGAQRAEPLEAMNAALSKALDASEARASELERKNHDLAAEHERLRKAYREVKAGIRCTDPVWYRRPSSARIRACPQARVQS